MALSMGRPLLGCAVGTVQVLPEEQSACVVALGFRGHLENSGGWSTWSPPPFAMLRTGLTGPGSSPRGAGNARRRVISWDLT